MEGEVKPFVAASLHPNGVYSVGVFPRVIDGNHHYPEATLHCEIPSGVTTVAIDGTAAVLGRNANNNRLTSDRSFFHLGTLCCSEYISHKGITNWLRKNEIVNEPEEIDPRILEMLDYGFVSKIEHKHKIYRRK